MPACKKRSFVHDKGQSEAYLRERGNDHHHKGNHEHENHFDGQDKAGSFDAAGALFHAAAHQFAFFRADVAGKNSEAGSLIGALVNAQKHHNQG